MKTKFVHFFVIFSFLFLSACGTSPRPPYSKPNPTISTGESNTPTFSGKIFTHPGSSRDGATLHAVIVADTNDSSVGKSVKVDLTNMQSLLGDISRHTGLATAGKSVSGRELSRGNVMTAINSLSIKSNDVVIFYYSGHGFNPGNSKWPGMDLKNGRLTLKKVRNTLQQKNPRLLIVIADTCNGFTRGAEGGFRYSKAAEKQKNYRELFLKYRGTITASSSKPGQFSRGNKIIGGYYTDALLINLSKELASLNRPSWQALMKRANKPITKDGFLQEPQSKVQVEYRGNTPTTQIQQTPHVEVSPGQDATITCQSYFKESGQECCRLTNGQKRCWADD